MLDEIRITVTGGHGGDGVVGFRRERYVPRGGPDGGDGGDGGSVVLVADQSLVVLDKLRRTKTIRAEKGASGGPAKRHGKSAPDRVVKVPAGTIVWEHGKQIADLTTPGDSVIVAEGGAGGRGNARFATSTRRAPHIAERGLPGGEARLRLELRLLADVGLVGLPNAGKSSLLRALSAARPKIGAYPFTTLEPHLGVVETGYETYVVADIPGLIEGAHEGAGLGIDFLQHIRRTAFLVHVVDATCADLEAEIETVRGELEAFGHGLVEKPWLVALNKIDLPDAAERAVTRASELEARGVASCAISALSGDGVQELARKVAERVLEQRRNVPPQRSVPRVLRPRPMRPMKAKRSDGVIELAGDRPERAALQLGDSSEEARAELVRRLRRMGALRALRKAGAQTGDTVRIGEVELKWPI